MQSETGSYLMQHPPYSGVYEPVWGPSPIPSMSFTNADETFSGDFFPNSSNHLVGSDPFDVMDSPFDSTSSMTSAIPEFKYLQLNSPGDPFSPTTQCCGGDFDAFNYTPTHYQQHFPQQLHDLLPPIEHPGYSLEEASDSDSGICSPKPLTSPTGENANWLLQAERTPMQAFFPTPDYTATPSSGCNRFTNPCNLDSQLLINMDEPLNYHPVDAISTSDKFLMETSHYPNPIKSEPPQGNAETWPFQTPLPAHEIGHETLRCPQIPQPVHPVARLSPSHQRITKKRTHRRRKRGADKEKTVHLWEFIRDILLEPQHCPSLMKWEDRGTGVFRFVKSDTVASMWGKKKQNPKMTYEKLSRAMRYYYNRGILERVDGRRLVYKFGPNAHGWKASDSHASRDSKTTRDLKTTRDSITNRIESDASKANSLRSDAASGASCHYDVTSAPVAPCKMENNEPARDVIDASSSSAGLLPSADVLLGKPTPHV